MTVWIITVRLTYPDGSGQNYTVVVVADTELAAKRRACKRIRRQDWDAKATNVERLTPASLRNGVLLYGRERDVIRKVWGDH